MKNCALGIVFSPDRQQVLLVQRRDLPVWVIPGGGIDDDETPEQAVTREVKEETGLTVTVQRKVAEYSPINRFTRLTHLYECQATGGELALSGESRQVRFYPLNQLPQGLFPYHVEWIQHATSQGASLRRQPMSRHIFRRVLLTYAARPLVALRYLCARLGFPINS